MTTTKYILTGESGTNTHIDLGLEVGNLTFEGQAFEIQGSDGNNSFFLRPAGYSFDFTDNKLGDDAIYLTGNRDDYAVSIVDNVATLTRGAGATAETVRVSHAVSNMTLVFADGSLLANTLAELGGEALNTDNTSLDFTAPAQSDGGVRVGTIGAVDQANIFGLKGATITAIGNGGEDEVFVAAGASVDATKLGVGEDRIYLEGVWSDYTKTTDGFQLTLTRAVTDPRTGEQQTEKVDVIGGIGASNDRLYFADGTVSTRDALLRMRVDPAADITTDTEIWNADETSFSSAVALDGVNNLSLTVDSGVSSSDGATSNGEVTVSGIAPGFAWQYSIDGGSTWTLGSGDTFTLDAQVSGENGAVYEAGQVQVRQINPFGIASAAVSNANQITVDQFAGEPDFGMAQYGVTLADDAGDNSVSTSVDHSGALSIQYWINLDSAAALSSADQQLAFGPLQAQLKDGKVMLWDGSAYQDSGVTVSEGWNFVSLSRSGTTFETVVVNETNPAGATGSVTREAFAGATGEAVRIGEDDTGTAQLAGVIRDLRIWDATRDQAQTVADSSADLEGSESNLIGYWGLDEPSGAPANEVSGGPALSLNGGAAQGGETSDYPGGNLRFFSALTPTIKGDGAAAFAEVNVYYAPSGGSETLAGATNADENGEWQFQFSDDLTAGDYDIRVEQTDLAGNVASVSAPLVVAAERLNAPDLVDASDSGASNADNITNVATPTLRGDLPADIPNTTMVSIYNGDTLIASGNDLSADTGLVLDYDADSWFYTPPTPLAAGEYAFSVEIDGNRSAALDVTIDQTADDPVITDQAPALIETATFDGGDLVVRGTLAADIDRVDLTWDDNDGNLGNNINVQADIEVQLDPDTGMSTKVWTATFTLADMQALSDGANVQFSLTATDQAGNTSQTVTSAPVTVEFDNESPTANLAQTIDRQVLAVGEIGGQDGTEILDLTDLADDDDVTTDDTAFIDPDAPGSQNATLTYSATWNGGALPDWLEVTEEGSIRIVEDAAVPQLLAPGTLTVTATDGAGQSADRTIEIDALAPPDLDAASDTGASDTDNITKDATPTLKGALPAGASVVRIYMNDNLVASNPAEGLTIVSGGAEWNYTPPNDLLDATYAFAVDVDGVRSPATNVTIDTAAPAGPVITSQPTLVQQATFDGGDLVVSGTLAADTHQLAVRWDDGDPGTTEDPFVDAVIDGNNWTATFPLSEMQKMKDGETVTFSLTATDEAGNAAPTVTSGQIVLELVNEAPTVNSAQIIPPQVLLIGQEGEVDGTTILNMADLTNDGETTPNDTAFLDADGNGSDNATLTYSATLDGGPLPQWLSITEQGVLHIIHGQAVPELPGGSGTLLVTATDGGGASVSRTITIETSAAPPLISQMHGETSLDARTPIVLETAGEAIKLTDVDGEYAVRLVERADPSKPGFSGETGDGSQTVTVTVANGEATFDGGSISFVGGKAVVEFDHDLDLANSFDLEVDGNLFVSETSELAIPAVPAGAIQFSTVTPDTDGVIARTWDPVGSAVADGDTWYDGTGGDYLTNDTGLSADLADVSAVVVAGRDADASADIVLDAGSRMVLTNFGADDVLYIDQNIDDTQNTIDENTIGFGNNNGSVPTHLLFSGAGSPAGALISFEDRDDTPEDESAMFAIAFTTAALGGSTEDKSFEDITGNGAPVISG